MGNWQVVPLLSIDKFQSILRISSCRPLSFSHKLVCLNLATFIESLLKSSLPLFCFFFRINYWKFSFSPKKKKQKKNLLKVQIIKPTKMLTSVQLKKILTSFLWEVKKIIKILIVFFFSHNLSLKGLWKVDWKIN